MTNSDSLVCPTVKIILAASDQDNQKLALQTHSIFVGKRIFGNTSKTSETFSHSLFGLVEGFLDRRIVRKTHLTWVGAWPPILVFDWCLSLWSMHLHLWSSRSWGTSWYRSNLSDDAFPWTKKNHGYFKITLCLYLVQNCRDYDLSNTSWFWQKLLLNHRCLHWLSFQAFWNTTLTICCWKF